MYESDLKFVVAHMAHVSILKTTCEDGVILQQARRCIETCIPWIRLGAVAKRRNNTRVTRNSNYTNRNFIGLTKYGKLL